MRAPRVLLVGSYRDTAPDPFRRASQSLARALAPEVRQFIVCSLSETTMDHHALKALKSSAPDSSVLFIHPRPEDPDGPDADLLKAKSVFQPLEVKSLEISGGYRAAHLRALQECDLVIAMGGSPRGTSTVIYSADVLGKPTVLIPTFGQAAEAAWRDFSRLYTDTERDLLRTSSDDPSWAANVSTAALSIARRNPFSKANAQSNVVLLLIALIGVTGWLGVQRDLARSSPVLTVAADLVAGLAFAAVVGLVVGERDRKVRLGAIDVVALALNALVVSFTIVLFSEGVGYVIQGGTTLFDLTIADARGLLLRESVFALLAGMVGDRYFDSLWRRAREKVS